MRQVLGSRTRTNQDVLDDQVFQDQRIAAGADTAALGRQIDRKSDRFGPLCVRVRKGDDLTHYQASVLYAICGRLPCL